MKTKNQLSQKGFSLFELVIYIAITGVAGGLMVGILTNVLKVQVRESASVEVMGQLNFVNQTIQRLVRESSLIEFASSTPVSMLKLRMADSTKDPTCISLVGGVIKLAEGPGSPLNNCATATSDLTSDKVIVDSLDFTKFSQYPGHDAIQINIAMTSTENSQVSQELRSGVARVSAATFDSDVLPGGPSYDFSLGQLGSPWQNLYVSGDICSEQYGCLSTGWGSEPSGSLSGSGVENYIAKWGAGSPSTLLNSSAIYQFGGSIGIGTTGPSPSAILDITSTNKGLLPPRMTTTQRDAITGPAAGLFIYNTNQAGYNFYNGTSWNTVDWKGCPSGSSDTGYGFCRRGGIFSALTWYGASARCALEAPGGRLCTLAESRLMCFAGLLSGGLTTWTSQYNSNGTATTWGSFPSGTCDTFGQSSPTTTWNFYCCSDLK